MNVRPFLIANPARLEAWRQHLSADIRRWANGWFGAMELGAISVRSGEPALRAELSEVSLYRSRADNSWAIVGALPQAVRELGTALLESDAGDCSDAAHTSLLADLVRSALGDLVCHLLHAAADDEYHVAQIGVAGDLIPDDAQLPGAGVMQLEIDLAGSALYVWLPLQRVAALHGEMPTPSGETAIKLVSLDTAVARQQVRAEVVLGQAEVSVGALASLRVGDVIGLEQSLDEPLCLRFDESPSRFAVWLGRRGRNMAVRIDDISN